MHHDQESTLYVWSDTIQNRPMIFSPACVGPHPPPRFDFGKIAVAVRGTPGTNQSSNISSERKKL